MILLWIGYAYKQMKTQLFYHKRPMFGLDIGSQSVKFIQLDSNQKKATIKAYGSIATDDKIMQVVL